MQNDENFQLFNNNSNYSEVSLILNPDIELFLLFNLDSVKGPAVLDPTRNKLLSKFLIKLVGSGLGN